MSDESAPADRTPPTPPDQPPRVGRAAATIDQQGRSKPDPVPPGASTAAEPLAAGGEPPAGTPPAARRGAVAPALGGLAVLVLAGAIGYVWYQQQQAQPGADRSAEVQALASRVTALEQRKGPDLSRIESRLATLEQRQPADLSQIQGQVKALEQQVAGIAQLSQRVDSLGQQVQFAASRSQQTDSALKQRLDADASRLATLEESAGKISKLADRAIHLARLQVAQMALAQGQKLGDLPGAPGALARYAETAPPTVAALRLAFPDAERAAAAASSPDTAGKTFLERVKAHAEELVTVRQGDHVLVGNATAGVLARARAALDAGDLAAAVHAVSSLSGPPAQAMADWLDRAKALLAARSALADMVAHA